MPICPLPTKGYSSYLGITVPTRVHSNNQEVTVPTHRTPSHPGVTISTRGSELHLGDTVSAQLMAYPLKAFSGHRWDRPELLESQYPGSTPNNMAGVSGQTAQRPGSSRGHFGSTFCMLEDSRRAEPTAHNSDHSSTPPHQPRPPHLPNLTGTHIHSWHSNHSLSACFWGPNEAPFHNRNNKPQGMH